MVKEKLSDRKRRRRECMSAIQEKFGKEFVELVDDLPIWLLLEMGKRVAPTDFAVRFYYDKRHPKFHLNRKSLRKAIRRAWSRGAFEHPEQLCEMLFESENHLPKRLFDSSEPSERS